VDNNTIIDEEQKIAESFALHLNDIFGTPTQINIDPKPPDTPTTSNELNFKKWHLTLKIMSLIFMPYLIMKKQYYLKEELHLSQPL